MDQIERAMDALWPLVLTGDEQAVRTYLRLMERRSRVLGLGGDQP